MGAEQERLQLLSRRLEGLDKEIVDNEAKIEQVAGKWEQELDAAKAQRLEQRYKDLLEAKGKLYDLCQELQRPLAASELVEDEDVPSNYHEQVAFNSHVRDAMAQMLDSNNVSNQPSLHMMLLESDLCSWAASLGREAAKALIAQQPHDSDEVTDQAQ